MTEQSLDYSSIVLTVSLSFIGAWLAHRSLSPHITNPKKSPMRNGKQYWLSILQNGKWRCKEVKRIHMERSDYIWREGVKPET